MKELLSSLTEKLTQFIEILVVLGLDFGLTIAMWFFKSKTDALAGFLQMQERDRSFGWIITVSSYGLYTVLALFIIADIFKHAFKTYIQIRRQMKEL